MGDVGDGDGVKKILMFSDIEGCQASPAPQSTFLCSDEFYDEIARRLGADPNLEVAFLGDYFDQGMRVYNSIKGMDKLLNDFNYNKDKTKKEKERVHVILGNRDVNKLRFCYELPNRELVKNSIPKHMSSDNSTLQPGTKRITNPDGTQKDVKICPNFDKGWSAWNPYFYGIYKDEIINPPNYTVKGYIKSDSDVVKHILMSSMGANKEEDGKMTGLYSFMPYDMIKDADDDQALKYLKVSLGIIPKDDTTSDALDLLGFFKKCKIAHVFNGKVLLAHGGGFDPDAFFDKAYVDSFGKGVRDITPDNYHSILEKFRQRLSGDVQKGGYNRTLANEYGNMVSQQNRERIDRTQAMVEQSADVAGAIVDPSVAEAIVKPVDMPMLPEIMKKSNVESSLVETQTAQTAVESSVDAYNKLLDDVLSEISGENPVFTWKFVLLQALGLKPDNEDARYKSLIQSCSQDGCKGPNIPLSTDPIVEIDEKTTTTKLAKILKDSGITHVSYGHKPICFPIPVIYKRTEVPGVTFISNDTSNGNRKVEEIGENTAIGTMVIFDEDGVKTKIEPVELNGREAKVGNYSAMYDPLTLATTPIYQEENGENVLKYGNGKIVFNNLLIKEPPEIAYGQLKFKDVQPAQESSSALPMGGKRRSRHRKQHKSKRGSKRGGSKKTIHRRRHKHTKRGRKVRR